MWFRTDRLRNYDNPIDCNFDYASPSGAVNSGNIGPRYEINASGISGWVFGSLRTSNDPFVSATTGTIATNNWYHTVFTYDGNFNETTATAYLDGAQTGTANPNTGGTYGWVGVFKNLVLGKGFGLVSGRFFDGKIGEVRLYNRALTSAEVSQNYNATKSKYINEASNIAVKIGPKIIYNGAILNYDFGNKFTYDEAQNLITDSQDFDKWTLQPNCSVADSDIPSPLFGDKTVSLITANQTEASLYKAFTGVANTNITYSVFLKAGSVTQLRLRDLDGGSNPGHNITFDLETLTFSDNNNVATTGYEAYPNGWYRVYFTIATGSYTNLSFNPRPTSSQTGTWYMWGAQVEVGSTAGRYIKTYGDAITAPTTVKNLSEDRFTGTADGCTFNSDGYFEFDGVNDEMNIAHSSNMAFINSLISIEAWVYIDTIVNGGKEFSIVNKRGNNSTQNNNRPYVFGVNGDGRIRWILQNASTVCDTATGLIQTGQWYHLVATHDGTDAKIYVNNVLNKTQSSGTSSFADTGNIPTRIGSRYRNSDQNFSDGRIAELRVYNTGLSATEISKNFNATRGKYGV